MFNGLIQQASKKRSRIKSLEIKKENFDSETLEDIHKILNTLMKSDDKIVQKMLERPPSDEE